MFHLPYNPVPELPDIPVPHEKPDTQDHSREILERIRVGSALSDPRGRKLSIPRSFKKGGVVKKTGFAKLHKGAEALAGIPQYSIYGIPFAEGQEDSSQ
jgi:hypothetical protein